MADVQGALDTVSPALAEPEESSRGATEESPEPFQFVGQAEVPALTGVEASTGSELLAGIRTVSEDCIAYHTRLYFERHRLLTPRFSNDFSAWVATELGDSVLDERLSLVTPNRARTPEIARAMLCDALEDRLSHDGYRDRSCMHAPFMFTTARVVTVPLSTRASTLYELRDGIATVHASAIYVHLFECLAHRDTNDFATWVIQHLGRDDVGRELAAVSVQFGGLDRLRRELLDALAAGDAR